MTPKPAREFIDRDHNVANAYYALRERFNGRNMAFIKREAKKLIEQDPDFLDSYILLYEMLEEQVNFKESDEILDEAYKRALALITDEEGNWPDLLEWGWLENRHIIRTLLNKAISFWRHKQNENALDLFRNLLKASPTDQSGARNFILAIRMGFSYNEFWRRFDKGGYFDEELPDWFEEHCKKFPDEFEGWEEVINEVEKKSSITEEEKL